MKKFIALLMVVILGISLCACGNESSQKDQEKAQVKTKTEYIFTHYPDKDQYSETTINNVTTITYEYNESNQLVKSFEDNNTSEQIGHTETYTYTDGIMCGEAVGYYSTSSDSQFKQINKYDENNNIIYAEMDYVSGFQQNFDYTSTYEYTYGDKDEILTKATYNKGELFETSVYEYEYNEKGLPVKSTETIKSGNNGDETVWLNTYTYDSNGNLIVETHEVADIQGQRTSMWTSSQIVYTYN